MLRIVMGILLVATFPTLFGTEEPPMMSEEGKESVIYFDWKDAGTYQLPDSNSSLVLPKNHYALFGEEARQAKILMGDTIKDPIEAIICSTENDDIVIFENCHEGYVSIDDWKDVDSKDLIEGIKESTELANEEKIKNGIGPIHVVGWMLEPTLNRETNTVYMAIEGRDESELFVNSIALRLGREGFEKITWITDKDTYIPFGGELDVMLRGHSFNPGYQYTDYVKGDKMAGYGIAALVAAAAGGKILKSTGLLFIFKKMGGLIFAAIAAVFYKLKGYFKRNKTAD